MKKIKYTLLTTLFLQIVAGKDNCTQNSTSKFQQTAMRFLAHTRTSFDPHSEAMPYKERTQHTPVLPDNAQRIIIIPDNAQRIIIIPDDDTESPNSLPEKFFEEVCKCWTHRLSIGLCNNKTFFSRTDKYDLEQSSLSKYIPTLPKLEISTVLNISDPAEPPYSVRDAIIATLLGLEFKTSIFAPTITVPDIITDQDILRAQIGYQFDLFQNYQTPIIRLMPAAHDMFTLELMGNREGCLRTGIRLNF